jgi:hypothetical protein
MACRAVGTFGSRSAALGGSALWGFGTRTGQGAEWLHLLEAAPDDVQLADGAFVVPGAPTGASPGPTWPAPPIRPQPA